MAKDPTATTAYAANRFAPRPALSRAADSAPVGRSMSLKQRDFVATLVTRADDYTRRMLVATPVRGAVTREMLDEAIATFTPATTVANIQATLNRTDVDARTLIDILLAQDKALRLRCQEIERKAAATGPAAPAVPAAVREDGKSYRTPDGRVFHAYTTQSGRLCAKLWNTAQGAFVYWGLASRIPAAAQEMTLADAEAFGQATGTCSQCMRHLTNDESVKRGIGPICASRM